MLLFLDAEGSNQGADTDTGSTQVVYLINFQAGVDLAAASQNFIYLVSGHGIQAAAKGV